VTSSAITDFFTNTSVATGPTPGTWTLVTYTYDASGNATVYLDGVPYILGTTPGSLANQETGAQQPVATLPGSTPVSAADVSFFNAALDQTQVSALYSAPSQTAYDSAISADEAISNFPLSEASYYPLPPSSYATPTAGPNSTTASSFPYQTYVLAPSNPSATLANWTPSAFTVNSLVEPTNGTFMNALVVSSESEEGTGGVALQVDNTGGSFDIATANACASLQDSTFSYPFPTNSWTMITLTYDSSTGTADVYADGVEIASTSAAGCGAVSQGGTIAPYVLADNFDDTSDVNMGDIGFYDYALAPSELAALATGYGV
jgi:hypothetical protein